jgi:DNA recombination protein RmuC
MLDFSPWIIVSLVVAALALFGLGAWVARLASASRDLLRRLDVSLEARHRVMLTDLHEGLARQAERITGTQSDAAERLRAAVVSELTASREAIQTLRETQVQISLRAGKGCSKSLRHCARHSPKQDALKSEMLNATLQKIAAQGRADQELIQTTLHNITLQVNTTIEGLPKPSTLAWLK